MVGLSVERGMRLARRAGAYIGGCGRAIVGTHGAVEFPHAPPVRRSCRGARGARAAARARRKQSPARAHAATPGPHNSLNLLCYRSPRLGAIRKSSAEYWERGLGGRVMDSTMVYLLLTLVLIA